MKKPLFLLCTLALLFCGTGKAKAQFQNYIPYDNTPLLIGIAEAPKTVKVSTSVIYAVSVTDSDDWYMQGGGHIKVHDVKTRVRPNAIRSMVLSTVTVNLRGTSLFTSIWDVVGMAIATPGVYADSWSGYNDRSPETDKLYDSEYAFNQTVVITN